MNLVLTICSGDTYNKISEFTHNSIRRYAESIKAEFFIISDKKMSNSTPHWEKFQIFELLNKYERIIFIDTDVIIREDCPNLFDIVPAHSIGIFNEAPFVNRSKELMIDVCKTYNKSLPTWNGSYYNTGVMVVSRIHKYLFKKPDLEYCSFYEQGYLNMVFSMESQAGNLEIYDLGYKFNRMTCLDNYTGEDRHASYIIHYAGFTSIPLVLELIHKDLEIWKRDKGSYKYKKHIYVSVAGGLGDQIDAEPSLRFMREKIYPHDEFIIATHYPELFKHIDAKVYLQGTFPGAVDIPYYKTNSLPPPESITWSVVSNLLCHTVDYCSISLLKRTLPIACREIKLQVKDKDLEELSNLIKNPEEYIVIHPGKHWQSKTLPVEYWQEIIDRLTETKKVCIIGRDEKTRGTLDIRCPEKAIDLRNLTNLSTLIALISKAKMVMSNDSAPIHIAGAFDNWICLIPTCKHPDHVLPYRKGSNYYKAIALYKKLPCDEFNADPTNVYSTSAEFIMSDWSDYLLEPEEVISRIKEIL